MTKPNLRLRNTTHLRRPTLSNNGPPTQHGNKIYKKQTIIFGLPTLTPTLQNSNSLRPINPNMTRHINSTLPNGNRRRVLILPKRKPLRNRHSPRLNHILRRRTPLIFLQQNLAILPGRLRHLIRLFGKNFRLHQILPLRRTLPRHHGTMTRFVIRPNLRLRSLFFPNRLLRVLQRPTRLPIRPRRLLVLPR